MRMTLTATLVLQAIARGHRFGFEIVDVTGGATGTVYPALRRLEHAGYVRSEWEREQVASRATAHEWTRLGIVSNCSRKYSDCVSEGSMGWICTACMGRWGRC